MTESSELWFNHLKKLSKDMYAYICATQCRFGLYNAFSCNLMVLFHLVLKGYADPHWTCKRVTTDTANVLQRVSASFRMVSIKHPMFYMETTFILNHMRCYDKNRLADIKGYQKIWLLTSIRLHLDSIYLTYLLVYPRWWYFFLLYQEVMMVDMKRSNCE